LFIFDFVDRDGCEGAMEMLAAKFGEQQAEVAWLPLWVCGGVRRSKDATTLPPYCHAFTSPLMLIIC